MNIIFSLLCSLDFIQIYKVISKYVYTHTHTGEVEETIKTDVKLRDQILKDCLGQGRNLKVEREGRIRGINTVTDTIMSLWNPFYTQWKFANKKYLKIYYSDKSVENWRHLTSPLHFIEHKFLIHSPHGPCMIRMDHNILLSLRGLSGIPARHWSTEVICLLCPVLWSFHLSGHYLICVYIYAASSITQDSVWQA